MFRENALGRFRDLLEVSAKSPSMLIYLDGISNVASDPNENYARELMELHTMGVDGGYTQDDVEEVARAFTGWQIADDEFFFNPDEHDNDAKEVLGEIILENGGISDGHMVLDIVSQYPSTASFICRKLSQLLVSDAPSDSLVSACATTFSATHSDPDQIAQVVRRIVTHTDFSDAVNYRSKFKTPLELVAGLARILGATGSHRDLDDYTRSMGMRLFNNSIPTGFAEEGRPWINPGAVVERIKFVDDAVFRGINNTDINLGALIADELTARGLSGTADDVVAVVFALAFGDTMTALELETARDVLTEDDAVPFAFDPQNQDVMDRVSSMVGIVLSYPGYQYQ